MNASDVYRAYLARRRLGGTLSRTVGTILAERILDRMVPFPLLLVTALLTFQAPLLSAHGSSIRLVLVIGLALVGLYVCTATHAVAIPQDRP